MSGRLARGVALALIAVVLAPTAGAATTWTARFTGHGAATLTGARLALGLTGYRSGSTSTITLRKGSCTAAGALVLTVRVVASSTGRLARTIYLTPTQARAAARLPLALRVGTRCAPFTAPVPMPGVFGDGTWRVGTTAIPFGTYRSANVGDSCYWARLSAFGGSDIIENGIGSGPAVVTITEGDVGFRSSRCGTWRLNAPAVPTVSPGDGTWRIGVDIAPGTYEVTVPDGGSCYWARLSGFGGGEIIENGITTVGPAIVTIAPTDAGFHSSRCGAWTLAP